MGLRGEELHGNRREDQRRAAPDCLHGTDQNRRQIAVVAADDGAGAFDVRVFDAEGPAAEFRFETGTARDIQIFSHSVEKGVAPVEEIRETDLRLEQIYFWFKSVRPIDARVAIQLRVRRLHHPMRDIQARFAGPPGCREFQVDSGIILTRREVPSMNTLEAKRSLNLPGAALVAAGRIDSSGKLGIEQAAQPVIGSARQTRGVRQGCAFPAEPKVRGLQARGSPADRASQAQRASALENDRGTHRMSLEIQGPAARTLQIQMAGHIDERKGYLVR